MGKENGGTVCTQINTEPLGKKFYYILYHSKPQDIVLNKQVTKKAKPCWFCLRSVKSSPKKEFQFGNMKMSWRSAAQQSEYTNLYELYT